jgi:hypothetical protein
LFPTLFRDAVLTITREPRAMLSRARPSAG